MHIDVENQNNQNFQQQHSYHTKTKYKIDYKKFGTLLSGIVLLVAIIFGGIWFFGRDKKDDPIKVYDVAVQLKDQKNSDPEEDAKNSLKAGDAALVRETGREWSNTEKISYLIIKMKIRQSQAQKLMESETKKLSEKEAIERGLADEERMKEMTKEERKEALKEVVRLRKYRIKIEELDFDPMRVREAQPFPNQEFGWKIVERK